MVRFWISVGVGLLVVSCASRPQNVPDAQPTAAAAWPAPAPSAAPQAQSGWPAPTPQHDAPRPTSASAPPAPIRPGSASCFQGYTYIVASALDIPADFARAPAAELRSCSFKAQVAEGALAFEQAHAGTAYVVRYQGYFNVTDDGPHIFKVLGDTPWRLSIDERLFYRTHENITLPLTFGRHSMVIEYIYVAGKALAFDLQVQSPSGISAAFSVDETSPYKLRQQDLPNVDRRSEFVHVDAPNNLIRLQQPLQFEEWTEGELRLDEDSKTVVRYLAATLRDHPEIAQLRVETACSGLGWRTAREVRGRLLAEGVAPHRTVVKCAGPADSPNNQQSDSGIRFVILPSVPTAIATNWAPTRGVKELGEDLRALVASQLGLSIDDVLGSAQASVDDWYQVFVNSGQNARRGWRLGLSYSPNGSRRDLGILEESPVAWTAAEAARLGKTNAKLYGTQDRWVALIELREHVYASASHTSRAELLNLIDKLDVRVLQNFVRASYGEITPPHYAVKTTGNPALAPELLALIGKYPYEMPTGTALDKELKQLLGKKYAAFKERLTTSSPIVRQGDYAVGEGQMPHYGGSEDAYFTFGLVKGDLHCGIRIKGQLQVFSSPGTKPPAEFQQVLGAAERRGRALFGR